MSRSTAKERKIIQVVEQKIDNNLSSAIDEATTRLTTAEGQITQSQTATDNRFNDLIGQWNGILQIIDGRIQVLESSVAMATYGEEAIVDNDLGLILARQLRFEGSGVNATSVNGFLRRFNGMLLTNDTGMFFDRGAVIVSAEFTCENNLAGRTIEFRHYDRNGNNQRTAGQIAVNLEKNQFGFVENTKIIIPARRRFAPWMNGSEFRYPQLRIAYRKVLEVIN